MSEIQRPDEPALLWSWRESPTAEVLSLAVSHCDPAITSHAELDLSRQPEVVSLPLARMKLKTISFRFPQPSDENVPETADPQAKPAQPAARPAARIAPPPTVTRLKPPGDIVKLEDRLFYVLQPSLETLIADSSLAFPFVPFAYQLE